MSKMYVVLCFLFNLLCLAKSQDNILKNKGKGTSRLSKKGEVSNWSYSPHIFVLLLLPYQKKWLKQNFLFLC